MGKIAVAVFDRNPTFLHLLCHVLMQKASEEVELIGAETDVHKLTALSSGDVAVLLVGLSVPGIVEVPLIDRLRERWPQSRIVLLSWIDLEEYRVQAFADGVDAVVSKTELDSSLLPVIRQLGRHNGFQYER